MAGVLLNKIFPVWLITICLIAILTYLTFKTFTKGFRLYRQEQTFSAEQAVHPVCLQAVRVDPGGQGHADAVHNLLRSISDRPDSPRSSLSDSADQHLHTKQIKHSMPVKASPLSSTYRDDNKAHLFPMNSSSSTYSVKIPAIPEEQSIELTGQGKMPSCDEDDSAPQLSQDSDSADDDRLLLLKDGCEGGSEMDIEGQAHDRHQLSGPASHVLWSNFKHAVLELPWRKIMAASSLWIVFASLQLAKGLSNRCSTAYWLLYLSQTIISILASAYFVRAACQGPSQALPSIPPPVKSDQVEWSVGVLAMASIVAVGGGAMAGTVGMGGGVVMGPLLLYLDVPPAASAATSTVMILFSSSAATLSFAVDGHINVQYACIYGTLNFISSFLGVFLLGRAVKRSGKSSIIVLMLALMMAVGAFISAVFGGVESVHDVREGRDLAFSSLCS